jgi:hypothetical protein
MVRALEIRLSPIPIITDDVGSGYDVVFRKDMRFLKDVSEGLDTSYITISVGDLGTSLDTLLLVERALPDIATGYEVRLSPIPITTSDTSVGAEVSYFLYWEPIVHDYGEGREYSALSTLILVADTSLGTDISVAGKVVVDYCSGYDASMPERVLSDSGVGAEIRLSPIPLLTHDVGVGVETEFFIYRELIKHDLASALDSVFRKHTFLTDSALGTEVYKLEIPARDSAQGLSIVYSRGLEAVEYGEGVEIRLSPIPVKTGDTGVGSEEIVFRDFVRDDEGRGIDYRILQLVGPPLLWVFGFTSSTATRVGYMATSLDIGVNGEVRELLSSGAVATCAYANTVEANNELNIDDVLSVLNYRSVADVEPLKL